MSASRGPGAARVIDGAGVARDILAGLRRRVEALAAAQVRPGLAAIQVGDDPASRIYVRNKARACDEAGVYSEVHRLAGGSGEGEVVAAVRQLNGNPRVHGILLQLPLPSHLDATRILQAIAPEKDVDGLTWASLGALLSGRPVFEPCTPSGVIRLIEHAGVAIDGRHAVVVGRSTIVGKPMALLLMARGATVTICHSRTAGLGEHARRADILVAAAGRPGLVTADMVRPGATVMDVGINRLPDGRLAGDVDFAGVSRVAGWITPVPGGVGPMTVAMLIENTVRAAERGRSTPAA